MNESIRKHFLTAYGSSLSAFLKATKYELRIGPTATQSQPLRKNVYLCPFCNQAFYYFRNNEYFENCEFSVDHFPPKSVGGNNTALVCAPCNSSFGSNLDYVLRRYLEFKRFIAKSELAKYRLQISHSGIPGAYNQDVYWQKGKLVNEINFNKYPLIKDWIFTKTPQKNFRFNLIAPSENSIQKALLRAAYLYCFHNWGYNFSMSETALHIRNVIDGKEDHPLKNLGVFYDILSDSDFENGFYFNDTSPDLRTFVVFFDIQIEDPLFKKRVFVLIPGDDSTCWNALTNFGSLVEKKETNFSLIQLFSDSINRGDNFAYSQTWHYLNKNI